MRYVALRYFNAAGATVLQGERHDPETHLVPFLLLLIARSEKNPRGAGLAKHFAAE
jgi:UDP-glucose 4-epimerase